MAQSVSRSERIGIPQRLERLPLTSYQKKIFLIIATAWLFDSVDLAMLTFVLGSLKTYFNLSTAQTGLLSSMSFLGMFLGAGTAGMLADRFGRKLVFQWSMVIWGAASILCGLAQTPQQLALLRILLGFGMGMEFPIGQSLVSEFIPAQHRGKYIALLEGFWPLGFITAGLLAYIILPIGGWRWVFIAEGIPAIFVLIIRRIVPESPRWLEDRGRLEEADRVMSAFEEEVKKALGGQELPPPKPVPYTTAKTERKFSFFDLWAPGYAKRTVMIWCVWFFGLLGYYGLTTWLGAMLQLKGFAVTKSVFYTLLISLAGVPGFFTAAYAVEVLGRKPSAAIAFLGSAIAAYLYGTASTINTLITFGLCMQFFMFGMWSVIYAYTPELYPTRARATGAGFASSIGRVGALIGPYVVGVILPRAGQHAVFALGALAFVIAALAVIVLGEETKGRVLEEISA
ncbi:MFS transporter, putative metabolite:H+ symporter [Thermanaeromonas toyohensis ToBE]|uniref:MFS transporter, putative metabolite:H+ symporter n=1 Tax=Thermanaeromonas toyohensis ToBE TaxID=698762 RepID=A0A1W1W0C2_9FIRM|nr:MFS transporter [Thermanaeromonas toyohensis]SMB99067.1 MFS transporter, putative metabolite:H+ symporter [Thermanaeromonas toyohensis ToBE]